MGKKLSELPKKFSQTASATYIAGFDKDLSSTYTWPASTFQTLVWEQSASYNIDKISPIFTFVNSTSADLENINNKGTNNGYASLDAEGHLPFNQKPKRKRISLGNTAGLFITDASQADEYDVITNNDITIGNPINGYHGQICVWNIRYTGTHNVSLDTKFRTGNNITWTSTVDKFDKIGAEYNAFDDKWDIISFVANFPV